MNRDPAKVGVKSMAVRRAPSPNRSATRLRIGKDEEQHQQHGQATGSPPYKRANAQGEDGEQGQINADLEYGDQLCRTEVAELIEPHGAGNNTESGDEHAGDED
jgi:hypothetical protein